MNVSYIRYCLLSIPVIACFITQHLHANPSNPTRSFISGDAFRAIADHVIESDDPALLPEHVKPYDIIFFKPNYAAHFFNTIHPKIENPYILITHDSDFSPVYITSSDCSWLRTDLTQYLDDPKLIAWFAVNVDYAHPKLIHIPVGLANVSHPDGYGNRDALQNALENIPPLEDRSKKIYANFSLHTNPQKRGSIMDFLSQQSCTHLATGKPLAEYLAEVKQHRYIASPEGNGLDCYRTWEALLLGCIPVIQHSSLDPIFENLPVIFVNTWQDVNEEFLEARYQEIIRKSYNLEKIYADYWLTIIKSFQQKES